MFDCNTFKDKRHLLILVAITLPSKELQFCIFIIGIKDIFECFMMVLNYRAAEY